LTSAVSTYGVLGRRRLLGEALAGWSPQDRATLTRLTRRSSDRMLALMESVDLPGPQAGEPGSADRLA
jgi:hypothetical protein